MFCVVFSCLLVTFLFPLCYTHSAEESRFECGAHGKFEYCIDGIPGCVIGCHCHPGYYFDTDTKICEPNTKLTEDFLRRFMAEPTRVYPINTPTTTENIPTPTTTNVLDERVDEIAKDTDDLGEWLYNQFFKTIETQVFNNTTDDQPPTRRSGSDVFRPGGGAKRGSGRRRAHGGGDDNVDKPKRKPRKSSKGRVKKRKSKVHGLRRKLLRITEDDSLFESDSGTDSDAESSEDDSSSSKESSRESGSSDTSKEDTKKDKDDRDHGHKKVIIYNRRPRPPLPSFIFLPNMDTPYYPPIGLPPPPVLPMYPMIPIPPMPPFIPFIEQDKGSSSTTAAASISAASTATTVAIQSPTTENAPSSDPTPETDSTTTTTEVAPPGLLRTNTRNRPKGHRARKPPPLVTSEEIYLMRAKDSEPRNPIASKRAERIKLMQKLRERLKLKHRSPPPIPENDVDIPDEDTPVMNNIPFLQDLPLPPNRPKHRSQKDKSRKLNDVNFKYLTELIHRVNSSNPRQPPSPTDINEGLKQLEILQHSRRNFGLPINKHNDKYAVQKDPRVQGPEDTYFTNLGRQIASLIWDDEFKSDNNRADEQNYQEDLIDSIINENSYVPRPYWERSVRSPLTTLKNYIDRLNSKKESSDKNLFSLENEVKTFVRSTPSMSLQDLENMLSTMQKSQTVIKKSKQPSRQSNASFNVNLLPIKPGKMNNFYRRMYNPTDYAKCSPRLIKLANITNIKPDPGLNTTHYIDPPTDVDLPSFHNWVFNPERARNYNQQLSNEELPTNISTNASLERDNPNPALTATTRPFRVDNSIKNIPKKSQEKYLKFIKGMPVITRTTVIKPDPLPKYSENPTKYSSGPTVLDYKSLNYLLKNGNNHHYMFEASYPVDVPTYKRSFSKNYESKKPSYFHHELHHFDYFD